MDCEPQKEKLILTDEQIEKFKKCLEKATPYTKEEVMSIPFDSWDYDSDRLDAYDAQMFLKKAGLL